MVELEIGKFYTSKKAGNVIIMVEDTVMKYEWKDMYKVKGYAIKIVIPSDTSAEDFGYGGWKYNVGHQDLMHGSPFHMDLELIEFDDEKEKRN